MVDDQVVGVYAVVEEDDDEPELADLLSVFPLPDVAVEEGELTMTLHTALTPLPSAALAVITAEPALTPFTFPLELTVTIFELDEDHLSVLLPAPDGLTVALMVAVLPLFRNNLFLFRVILVTLILEAATFFFVVSVLTGGAFGALPGDRARSLMS